MSERCDRCGKVLDAEKGEVFVTDDGEMLCADDFQPAAPRTRVIALHDSPVAVVQREGSIKGVRLA